jgi:hypothetical protein
MKAAKLNVEMKTKRRHQYRSYSMRNRSVIGGNGAAIEERSVSASENGMKMAGSSAK